MRSQRANLPREVRRARMLVALPTAGPASNSVTSLLWGPAAATLNRSFARPARPPHRDDWGQDRPATAASICSFAQPDCPPSRHGCGRAMVACSAGVDALSVCQSTAELVNHLHPTLLLQRLEPNNIAFGTVALRFSVCAGDCSAPPWTALPGTMGQHAATWMYTHGPSEGRPCEYARPRAIHQQPLGWSDWTQTVD